MSKIPFIKGPVGDLMCKFGWHCWCGHYETQVGADGVHCKDCGCELRYIRTYRRFLPIFPQTCLRGCGKAYHDR